MPSDPVRRYEITSVLGQGGFGTVYRATLKGMGGFTKDVAIKLLKDENPPAEVLERFRDEARLLGLVRDRAVVHVEPPVRLDDRWAVVMDYVDGASLSRILRTGGALPPEVALEITREIARALHRLWNQPGPGDVPLNLRHRDLKPGNIQITPDGSVVLLDFGIAKATFDAREAHTSTGIIGSEGYIAPERFFGTEGPTTDVFSLGVVLYESMTRTRPVPGSRPPEGDALEAAALRLALRMCALEPSLRPEPRDVERECTELLRLAAHPGRLRDWAETAVPAASRLPADDLVGEVLTEAPTMSVAAPSVRPLGWALFAGGTTVVVVGAALAAAGVLILLGAAVFVATRKVPSSPTPVVAEAPAPRPAPVAPVGSAAPVAPAPAPDRPVPAVPAPGTPAPRLPGPAPAAPVAAAPADTVAATSPGPTQPVSFGSLPPDAAVTLDGQPIGSTPVIGWAIPEGSHVVTLTHGDRTLTKTIVVDRRAPVRYLWRIASDSWEGSR